MCTVKPFYKHYFSRIDKWDDKIANNFLELGYAVSIVVPLEKVKICQLIYQYIENDQGRWLANPKLYDRTQAASLFDEFLYVKDKLFGEAMDNWLKKRGSK